MVWVIAYISGKKTVKCDQLWTKSQKKTLTLKDKRKVIKTPKQKKQATQDGPQYVMLEQKELLQAHFWGKQGTLQLALTFNHESHRYDPRCSHSSSVLRIHWSISPVNHAKDRTSELGKGETRLRLMDIATLQMQESKQLWKYD